VVCAQSERLSAVASAYPAPVARLVQRRCVQRAGICTQVASKLP
jgi:hypothetical protein